MGGCLSTPEKAHDAVVEKTLERHQEEQDQILTILLLGQCARQHGE
jgi:hypothetical protein